ncbi:hypothetical protein AX14_001308 [Amanita brunnescens Koide BX004]|nr:hypothetical protein AX14_001308 [Amanita brunnescens Koide BX004]
MVFAMDKPWVFPYLPVPEDPQKPGDGGKSVLCMENSDERWRERSNEGCTTVWVCDRGIGGQCAVPERQLGYAKLVFGRNIQVFLSPIGRYESDIALWHHVLR